MSAAPRPGLGIALIVGTTACFAAMDSSVRWLGALVPVMVMLTARYAFQAAAMGVWLALDPRHGFRSAHPRFQLMRGTLLLLTSGTSFFGLQYLPVPEFTAINLLTPVLVTVLAALVLKERVSRARWALVAGSLAGALIVIRPGGGALGWPVVFPLAGCVFYAAFQVLTSRMAALESPLTTHFWTGLVGAAVALPLLLASPLPLGAALAALTPSQWALMALIGFLGTAGHLMLILAMSVAPASTLMPFIYTQLGSAALFGWLVFDHLPDVWAWVGMAVIAACGAAAAWFNVVRRAPPPVEMDTILE